MPKTALKIRAFPSNKGLQQSFMPGAGDPASIQDGSNFIFSITSSRKKFWGVSPYYKSGFTPTISGNMRGNFDFWRNVNGVQTRKLVSFAGGKVWADNNNGVMTDITGSAALLPNEKITYEVFFGYLLMFFGTSVPYAWDQTTGTITNFDAACVAAYGQHLPSYDAGTNPNPKFAFGRVFDQRLWIAGNKLYPHRIYYSSIGDPRDWRITSPGDAGSIDLDIGDNDPVGITAIFPGFLGDLYVAKSKYLYRIRPVQASDLSSTTYTVEQIVSGVGCVEHNSVVATPGDIIWASNRGIHSLAATDKYGDVEQTFLSYPIHKMYQSEVSFFNSQNMRAIFSEDMNSYILVCTSRGRSKNDILLGYNTFLGEWYQRKGFDCASINTFIDSRKNIRTMLATESLNIGLFDENKVSVFGQPQEMYFVTPMIYPAGPGTADMSFSFKRLWVFFRPQQTGTIKLGYQIDNKGTTIVDIPMTWEDTTAYASANLPDVSGSIIGFFNIANGIIGGIQGGSGNIISGYVGGGQLKKYAVELEGEGNGIQFVFWNEANPDNIEEDCEIYGFVLEAEVIGDYQHPTIT